MRAGFFLFSRNCCQSWRWLFGGWTLFRKHIIGHSSIATPVILLLKSEAYCSVPCPTLIIFVQSLNEQKLFPVLVCMKILSIFTFQMSHPYSNAACLTLQMCIDPTLSVALGDKPPPLYICEECSQRIAGYASVSPLFSIPRILPLFQ